MTHGTRQFAGAAASTTVAGSMTAIAPANSATLTVADATGWPTTNFVGVVDRGKATEEKIFFSSRSGTTFTVGNGTPGGRGFDSTVAGNHDAGATIDHELDADIVTKILEHVNDDAGLDHAGYLQRSADKGANSDITNSVPDDTRAAGLSGRYADAAHRHGREAAFTIPATYPRGVLYRSANLTTTQSGISGSADVTGLTAITVTGDGVRRVRIRVHLGKVTIASGQAFAYLYEGSTEIALLGGSDALQSVIDGAYDFVPAAGAHTYKIKVFMSGSISMAATNLSYAIAEDIGT